MLILNQIHPDRLFSKEDGNNGASRYGSGVDKWIEEYNTERTHSGKYCFGKDTMADVYG